MHIEMDDKDTDVKLALLSICLNYDLDSNLIKMSFSFSHNSEIRVFCEHYVQVWLLIYFVMLML